MDNLNLFKFPDEWGIKRIPARPKDLWVFNFEENYDWDNIWYDVIQISDTDILLIGPPLYNFEKLLLDNGNFRNGNIQYEYSIINFDRVSITLVTVTGQLNTLTFTYNNHDYIINVSKPSIDFKDQKTIVTISKNHPIIWLEQWIDYHRTVHNITGFLIYNNQSNIYSSDELETHLNNIINKDTVIKVIDYNVPFGCMGGGNWEWNGKQGSSLPWDSDFSQYIMLEHAKWKYLYCADLVLNADTDELLLINNGLTLNDIANYCKTSTNSVWTYKGTWIEPINSYTHEEAVLIPVEQRKFKNYFHTNNSNQRGIGIKWLLNPQRNMNYQWKLHNTSGPYMETNDISYAHFLPMNTGWSWRRDIYSGDISTLTRLDQLKNHLDLWEQYSSYFKKGNE